MGTKKITDLTLRSNVTDEVNFPVDDTIQSYRVTAAQLLAYILPDSVIVAAKIAANAVITAKILDANVTRAKLAVGAVGLVSIAAKTGDYTLTSSDDLVTGDSSGGAFSFTLPTAVGISGKRYWIKKIDSTVTVITLATTSSQTIDGSTTRKLNTQHEQWEVVSDGANWIVISHKATTPWVSFTPAITGASSNPVLGSSGNFYQTGRWRRSGDSIEVETAMTWGTSGASFGTGNYRITLPNSWSLDTSKAIAAGGGSVSIPCGEAAYYDSSATTGDNNIICAYDGSGATYVSLLWKGGGSFVTNSAAPITWATGDSLNTKFKVPISGFDA